VKFADPTGMQVLNPTYDVEGIYKYLPLPINVPEPTFDYIVTDNSWEEQAMATVRFNNAMYELNKVITAGTNNALAFIDHDRNAAVQRALANAAMASAQADAAGKAAGDVGRNALISNNCYAVVVNGNYQKQKFSTFDKINMTVTGTNAVITNADFMLYCEEIKLASDYGRIGKAMSVGGKAFGVVGSVFGMVGGYFNISDGNYIRGGFDVAMSIASLGATGLMWAGLISNPAGWTIIGISCVYSVATLGYDIYKSH
jgi:hypothetical protein